MWAPLTSHQLQTSCVSSRRSNQLSYGPLPTRDSLPTKRLDPGIPIPHGRPTTAPCQGIDKCFEERMSEGLPGQDNDPSIPEANACLGIAAVLNYDWSAAGRWFGFAAACNPVQPSMRCLYSQWYLAAIGRMKDAIEQIELALKADPLNLYFRSVAGWYRLVGDRPAEGVASLQQVLELDDTYWLPYVWLGADHLVHGRVDEAFKLVKRAYELASWNMVMAGFFAGILERTGDRAQAYKLLESFGDGTAFGAPVGLFCYCMSVNNIDSAAMWLEKAIEQRDTRSPWIVPNLFGGLFTSSSRWQELAKKRNLA
jgi:tetratricopeptide (TPR) repeat protein